MNASSHVGVPAALVQAATNALINGAIAFTGFRGLAAVPLSVDSISAGEKTVWSEDDAGAHPSSRPTCWAIVSHASHP